MTEGPTRDRRCVHHGRRVSRRVWHPPRLVATRRPSRRRVLVGVPAHARRARDHLRDQNAMIQLVVFGRAETQGSKVARHAGGKTWLTEGTGPKPQRHREWCDAVAQAARDWRSQHPDTVLIDGPVVVALRFFVPKPASAPKR